MTSSRGRARYTRHWMTGAAAVLVLAVLAGCAGTAAPPAEGPPAPPDTAGTPETEAQASSDNTAPCQRGRLVVGDLIDADASMENGIAAAEAKATAWQSDARLTGLRLGCPLLEPGFQWEGIFFSNSAQAYFFSETDETQPVEVDPGSLATLPLDHVSFAQLYRSLVRAGYEESAELSPVSGVLVRLSSDVAPFGPPEAPTDVVYFHVAIEERGEIRDLFVNAVDGTIYRYQL